MFEKPELEADLTFDRPADLTFAADAIEKRTTAGAELGIGHRQRIVTKSTRRKFYDLRHVPNAVALIGELPKAGETIHAIMAGDFAAWDLIPAVHSLLGCMIEELHVATLGFNAANNQHLCDLIDAGHIRRAAIVCSQYFEKANADVFQAARVRLEQRGQRIAATRCHAKLILIAPAGRRDRYTVESSANLRSCQNLEQFALSNDAKLYEFHKTWIESLLPPNI
jgi:hypothetical protein